MDTMNTAYDLLPGLFADVRALREALLRYGRHLQSCPQRLADEDPVRAARLVAGSCTCGWQAVLNQTSREHQADAPQYP